MNPAVATHPVTYQIDRLPPFPQVALKLYEKLQSTTSTLEEVSQILRTDTALSAKVLKLANSGYYSIPGGVKDVKRAFEFLGFNTIAQIVLTSSVTNLLRGSDGHAHFLKEFWRHSLGTAVAAELISKKIKRKNPSESFTTGLLHNIGKLVYLELDPEGLDSVLSQARQLELNFDEAAIQLRKPMSSELSEMLLKQWKIPESVWCGSAATDLVAFARHYATWKHQGHNGDFRAVSDSLFQEELGKLAFTNFDEKTFSEEFAVQMEKAGAFLHG